MASTSVDKHQITGLILAGGKGTRMGSVDKGLQVFRGTPMVEQVLQRLRPQVGKLIINANQHLDTYETLGAPVYPDEFPGFAGPLAGLHSGLMHCETPYLVTSPCDSPFLPLDLVDKLSAALMAANVDIAVAVTGESLKQQRHPVFCLLARQLKDDLADYLGSGGRKMDAWFSRQSQVDVWFADESAFANINTLEELDQWGFKST